MINKYVQFIRENNGGDLFPDSWKSQLEIEGDSVILHHFGKSGIDHLDPKMWGKHEYTKSENWWGKPRVYFYVNPDDQERIVGGTHYIVKYPLNKLYPFNSDPLNFYDKCADELETENIPVRRQVICISNHAEKAGYDGIMYRWKNTFVAVIWVEVPVEKSKEEKSNDIPKFDYVGMANKKWNVN